MQDYDVNRAQSPIIYSYNLIDSVLFRADNYDIDLDIKFSNSMDPSSHIDMLCCKTLKILGFVMRLTNEFTQNKTVKTLSCALVRPNFKLQMIVCNLKESNVHF